MLSRILLRLYLYLKGVRFFETSVLPANAEFLTAEFQTVNGNIIEFQFFREHYLDMIKQFGFFRKQKSTGIIIQAKIDGKLPSNFVKFNNLKMYFVGVSPEKFSDKLLSKVLLEIYIEYINAELRLK